MLIKAYGSAVCGIDAFTVTIEADVSSGLNYSLVGLPDNAVRESQQRISTALRSIGFRIPGKRVVINMAPADIRKEGAAYDLPLALSIMAASGQIDAPLLSQCISMGELALDGSLRPIRGALSMALHARECGFEACIFPLESAYEAAVLEGIRIFGVTHLSDVVDLVRGEGCIQPLRRPFTTNQATAAPDFSQVRGQEQAKRALEIAAAGGHNVLLNGSPGAGKTFMAQCLPGILPPLSIEEAIETTRIYSAAGFTISQGGLMTQRPFRSPHHTASVASLTGGGSNAMPGEISLAHNGVLYMDELPEFSRTSLEVLRQPLEEGAIHIARAKYKITYPSRFMLLASMNPCPCGYYGHPTKVCTCTDYQVQHYRNRISGPLLDRIDMYLNILPVETDKLLLVEKPGADASSERIRDRVAAARAVQQERFKENSRVYCNAQMSPALLEKFCPLSPSVAVFMKQALHRLQLSARAYHRILRLARTIADLQGSDTIEVKHIAESVQYR